MTTLDKNAVRHTATVAAPAGLVYDLVAQLAAWSQFHPPAVHAEPIAGEDGLVRHWWVVDDHTVRIWTARWRRDRARLRIAFERDPATPDECGSRGEWQFRAVSDSTTEIEFAQEPVGKGEHDPVRMDQNVRDFLMSVTNAAQHADERRDLVVDFEDPLFVAGSAEDAYDYLYEAAKWPERIPHVSRLVLEEQVPGIQFFDMDTVTPDGSAHTTRSVRICLPHSKIVYKQIQLPKLLDGHTGHWQFTPIPEGCVVSARHTATIKPSALPILGPEASVPDARKYLRRVLSANSMGNLRLSKAYAEERAGV